MTDRAEAIARAKELANARRGDSATEGPSRPRTTVKGPSAGRILAAAGATAAGVALVGVVAASAQQETAPSSPTEVQTVVVQVPRGATPAQVQEAIAEVAAEPPAPAPAPVERAPAAVTEGS